MGLSPLCHVKQQIFTYKLNKPEVSMVRLQNKIITDVPYLHIYISFSLHIVSNTCCELFGFYCQPLRLNYNGVHILL